MVTLPQYDVREFEPPEGVHGILAAPPCTQFSISGARWWKSKPVSFLDDALDTVQSCLRIIRQSGCRWWALENPVGRLRKFIGDPSWSFQPWEFGDPWFKKTCIWGEHEIPEKRPCRKPDTEKGAKRWKVSLTNHLSPTPTAEQIARLVQSGMIPSDWCHRLGPSPARATLRSITPGGFARAFFEANP
jgi:hypothetical protein